MSHGNWRQLLFIVAKLFWNKIGKSSMNFVFDLYFYDLNNIKLVYIIFWRIFLQWNETDYNRHGKRS